MKVMRLTLLSILMGQTEKGLWYHTSDIRLSTYINTTMNAIPMGDTSQANLWALTDTHDLVPTDL